MANHFTFLAPPILFGLINSFLKHIDMPTKFLVRSDEDYYEFNLDFCKRSIKEFKKSYFRKNSKHAAKIYAKAFFPADCPAHFYMYYLVFVVNTNYHQIISITKEAFGELTKGIEPTNGVSVELYTIEKHVALAEEYRFL